MLIGVIKMKWKGMYWYENLWKERYLFLFIGFLLLVLEEFREKIVYWERSFKEGFVNKVEFKEVLSLRNVKIIWINKI